MIGPRSFKDEAEDHGLFDELAVGWALHALEPEDESIFAAHLGGCARCARTVAETSEVMAAMAADLPAAEPSEALRTRLAAAVAETEQVPAPRSAPRPAVPAPASGGVPAPRSRPSFRRLAPAALVAAAVAAIVALAGWNVVLARSQDELRSTVAAQTQVMDSLLTPGHQAIAALRDLPDNRTQLATVVAHDRRVVVVARALSVNDSGSSTYVLWGMKGKTPVPLGTFDVVRNALDVRHVDADQAGLDNYTVFGVSLEAGRRAPAIPTHMVALGGVNS
jgi:anti-sigma-K factor RskA